MADKEFHNRPEIHTLVHGLRHIFPNHDWKDVEWLDGLINRLPGLPLFMDWLMKQHVIHTWKCIDENEDSFKYKCINCGEMIWLKKNSI